MSEKTAISKIRERAEIVARLGSGHPDTIGPAQAVQAHEDRVALLEALAPFEVVRAHVEYEPREPGEGETLVGLVEAYVARQRAAEDALEYEFTREQLVRLRDLLLGIVPLEEEW